MEHQPLLNPTHCGSRIEISESRLSANLAALKEAAGPATEILCVIKANAYGHRAETCAPVLARAGAYWLGVTNAAEGARVRASLSNPAEILVMSGFLPADVSLLQTQDLTPIIWMPDHVSWLAATSINVHIEIDTGMGRQGILPGSDLDSLLAAIAQTDLIIDGICTHFASSEIANSPTTKLQQQRFEQAVSQLRAADISPSWLHAGNTSTVDNPAQPTSWLVDLAATVGARAMVRSGLALYGYCLPIEGEANPHVAPGILPVMTWKAPVLSVRTLAPGETIGYNTTFTVPQSMRVALLPVGYADGLRRELSSSNTPGHERQGGWVILNNQRAPILGRISMNLTVVDITHIEGIVPGDEAILLGDGITANDHARLAQTIPYEILCNIKPGE